MRKNDSLAWVAVEGIATRILQFTIGVTMARMLLPEDYGLVGVVAVFIAIAQTLSGLGIGMALVQAQEVNPADEAAAFGLMLASSFVSIVLLFIAAPVVADFYAEPMVKTIMWVLSFQVLANSLGVIHSARLQRNLRFKPQAIISLSSTLLGGVVGIVLAANSHGVWSLVAQVLCASAVSLVLLWTLSDWRPSLRFDVSRLKRFWHFSSRSLANSLLFLVSDAVFPILIGKLYSLKDVGLFARANQLQQLPSHLVTDAIGRIAFPVFSRLQSEPVRLKELLRKCLRLMMSIHAPVMVGLFVIADDFIPMLFTIKWNDTVPLFKLLVVGGLFYPINALQVSAINALGRSDVVLRLELIKKFMLFVIVLATFSLGLEVMCAGIALHILLCSWLNQRWLSHELGYMYLEYLGDISVAILAALLMGLVVSWLQSAIAMDYPGLFVLVLAGTMSYACLVVILRARGFQELWSVVNGISPLEWAESGDAGK